MSDTLIHPRPKFWKLFLLAAMSIACQKVLSPISLTLAEHKLLVALGAPKELSGP